MKPVSRLDRKKARTRQLLLAAAYGIMSRKGVDATSIAEVTEKADIGFGTFYNYFESKDSLAAQVLDCVIDDLGRRNDAATANLKGRDPAAVQATSIRLTLREMLANPIWKWWCKRPELLAERLGRGFYKFGTRDLRLGIDAGRYEILPSDVDAVWKLQMWLLVGGFVDILSGEVTGANETRLIEAIMRAMGLPADQARSVARIKLPKMPEYGAESDIIFGVEPVAG